MNNLLIGSHVSFNKEQLLGSVKEALSYIAGNIGYITENLFGQDIVQKSSTNN